MNTELPFTVTADNKLTWKRGTISPVLTFDPPQSGISTIRALKNAIECLRIYAEPGDSHSAEDYIQAAIDDLTLMLERAEGKK